MGDLGIKIVVVVRIQLASDYQQAVTIVLDLITSSNHVQGTGLIYRILNLFLIYLLIYENSKGQDLQVLLPIQLTNRICCIQLIYLMIYQMILQSFHIISGGTVYLFL